MSIELATELRISGKAHSAAACLLFEAALTYAANEGLDDPNTYAFNGPYSLSIHYLLGLGLELMLKSAIVAWDPRVDADYLKDRVGHDLIKGLDEAEGRGFKSEAPHLVDLLKLLRDPYKQHWFRYGRPDEFPLPADFKQVAQTLTVFEQELANKLGDA